MVKRTDKRLKATDMSEERKVFKTPVGKSIEFEVQEDNGRDFYKAYQIQALIDFLNKAKAAGATHIDFSPSYSEGGYEGSHNVGGVGIQPLNVKIETDEDFNARIIAKKVKLEEIQSIRQRQIEAEEHQQYERLKKKFEV